MTRPVYEKPDLRIRFNFEMRSHPGKVLDVCHDGVGMYRWPGFLVDASFDSGMSGGPVVDTELRVRGVVCGDVSQDAENGSAGSGCHAFASALWPLMGVRTNVEIIGPSGSLEIPPHSPLLEWVRQGVLGDRGAIHNHLRIIGREDGSERFFYELAERPEAANAGTEVGVIDGEERDG